MKLDVKDFGAKGDGITDDTQSIQAAINAAVAYPQYETPEVHIVSGRYRITKTLIVGGYPIKPINAFLSGTSIINKTLYKLPEFQKGTYSGALKIKGIGTVSIHADFKNSIELEPVIAYQAAGDGRIANSTCQYTGEISNIGIYGKGSFGVDGQPRAREIPPYKTNNQVGLLGVYTTGLKLNNVSFWGLKEGLILNNCGMINAKNLKFDYCQRAGYEIQNHSGRFENTWVMMCDKGFEIRSNQMVMDVYYAKSCPVALHVAAGNNIFNSVYLEGYNTGEGQLVIGDNPGDPNAGTRLLSGIAFNMLTIVARKEDKSIGVGIVWKDNVRKMTISGGEIQSCLFSFPSHNLTKVNYANLTGTLPTLIATNKD